MRVLGREDVQQQAIEEMYGLPVDDPRRERILRLHALWSIRIEMKEVREFLPEGIVAYPQTFLDWEQTTRDRGKQDMVLRLVGKRCGEVSGEVRSRITSLPLPQLEQLGEDLLDFESMGDLLGWLERVG